VVYKDSLQNCYISLRLLVDFLHLDVGKPDHAFSSFCNSISYFFHSFWLLVLWSVCIITRSLPLSDAFLLDLVFSSGFKFYHLLLFLTFHHMVAIFLDILFLLGNNWYYDSQIYLGLFILTPVQEQLPIKEEICLITWTELIIDLPLIVLGPSPFIFVFILLINLMINC
jgi:hypothetical protein